MVLYKDCPSYDPKVKMGPARGLLSLIKRFLEKS
jgi:hypothetical protein